MQRKLHCEDKRKQTELQRSLALKDYPKQENLIDKKFPFLKHEPKAFKVSVFTKGAMVGEEDIVQKVHSTTVICNSLKGTVYTMP